MVAKKSSGKTGTKVKVGKLQLTKATVKDLTKAEAKKIKGGMSSSCSTTERARSAAAQHPTTRGLTASASRTLQ
jgi:hypothetical protein